MTDKKKYKYWLAVEESETVRFSDLAHMMADAMHPADDERMDYACARINLEAELKQAVKDGVLTVRNASGLGRHTFPHGGALQRAVLIPYIDLEPFLNARGIELRLTPHGSGPDYWTLENAAAALQKQLNWHDGARANLQDQLQQAAASGALVILDPHTCLPTRSEQVRTYWELVTPESVNTWLEKQGAPYRWSVARPVVTPEPQAAPVVADDAPEKQVNAMKKAALIAELEYEWSSIEADISDATRNGLKAAAHTGKHGEWDKDKARTWAVSKGKIKQTAPVHSLAGAWPGATTRHTISR